MSSRMRNVSLIEVILEDFAAIPAERYLGWYLPPNTQYGKLRDADILGLIQCASKYGLEMSDYAKKKWDTRIRLRRGFAINGTKTHAKNAK